MALSDAYDLATLIQEGKNNNYNIKDFSTLTRIGNSVLTVGGCIFDKYIDFIKADCIKVTFTSSEEQEYKYNPKKLSLILYQTEELWFLLLKLNNISSEIDFIPRKPFILPPDKLSLLNQILLINEKDINENHANSEFQ